MRRLKSFAWSWPFASRQQERWRPRLARWALRHRSPPRRPRYEIAVGRKQTVRLRRTGEQRAGEGAKSVGAGSFFHRGDVQSDLQILGRRESDWRRGRREFFEPFLALKVKVGKAVQRDDSI